MKLVALTTLFFILITVAIFCVILTASQFQLRGSFKTTESHECGTQDPYFRARIWHNESYVSDIDDKNKSPLICTSLLLTSAPDEWLSDLNDMSSAHSMDRRFTRNNVVWARRHGVCYLNIDASCRIPSSGYNQCRPGPQWQEWTSKFYTRWFSIRKVAQEAPKWLDNPKWIWHVDTDLTITNKNISLDNVLERVDKLMRQGNSLINPTLNGTVEDLALIAAVGDNYWQQRYLVNGGSLMLRSFQESPVTEFIIEAMIALGKCTTSFSPPSRFEPDDQGHLSYILETVFHIVRSEFPVQPWLDYRAKYGKKATIVPDESWYKPWREAFLDQSRLFAIGKFDYDAALNARYLAEPLLKIIPDKETLINTPQLVAISVPRMFNSAAGHRLTKQYPPTYRKLTEFECGDFTAHYLGSSKERALARDQSMWEKCRHLLPSPDDIKLLKSNFFFY